MDVSLDLCSFERGVSIQHRVSNYNCTFKCLRIICSLIIIFNTETITIAWADQLVHAS